MSHMTFDLPRQLLHQDRSLCIPQKASMNLTVDPYLISFPGVDNIDYHPPMHVVFIVAGVFSCL